MGSVKQTRRLLKWVGNALLVVMLVWIGLLYVCGLASCLYWVAR